MIKHIVMWKLKESAHNMDKKGLAVAIKDQLEALPAKIAEIQSLEVGINVSTRDVAFDIVLYSEFASHDDLQAYQVHPDHEKVKDFIVAAVDKSAVVDYEI